MRHTRFEARSKGADVLSLPSAYRLKLPTRKTIFVHFPGALTCMYEGLRCVSRSQTHPADVHVLMVYHLASSESTSQQALFADVLVGRNCIRRCAFKVSKRVVALCVSSSSCRGSCRAQGVTLVNLGFTKRRSRPTVFLER